MTVALNVRNLLVTDTQTFRNNMFKKPEIAIKNSCGGRKGKCGYVEYQLPLCLAS